MSDYALAGNIWCIFMQKRQAVSSHVFRYLIHSRKYEKNSHDYRVGEMGKFEVAGESLT